MVQIWTMLQTSGLVDKDLYTANGPVWALVFILISAASLGVWRVWVDWFLPRAKTINQKDDAVAAAFTSMASANQDMKRALEEQTSLLRQIVINTQGCPVSDIVRKSQLHTSDKVKPEGGQA